MKLPEGNVFNHVSQFGCLGAGDGGGRYVPHVTTYGPV